MGQVTRFARFHEPKLTYRLGYDPADELQQVPDDAPIDLAADDSVVIEVARQVDVESPVSDLAAGITPVAFGASPTWTNPGNMTDGNATSYGSGPNYVEPGTVDKGFSIDLGAPASVGTMQFAASPYAPSTLYHIESSPDNTTWTDRPYTRTGPVGTVYTYTLTGGPFTFRYWRIRRSYHGYIGPQRIQRWTIPGSTTTSSDKTWFGTALVNDGDDATYEDSDGVDEVLRMLFDIDQKLAKVILKVGSEFSGSVTYELQHATALDFSDAATDATFTLTTTGSYTLDEITFTWVPTDAYSLWQIVSSEDENRRFYTIEAYEDPTDLTAYQLLSEKDQPDGYPSLDADGQVPVAELPLIEELLTAETDATKVLQPDGAGGVEWGMATGGSALTVEEVDGSPTDAAITKIVFPNGTLSIVGHVATYTAAASGSALTVKDEGSNLDTAVTSINFVGGTVVATAVGHAITVTTPDFGTTGDMTAEAIGSTASAGSTGKLIDAGHRHAMPGAATPSGGYGTAAAGVAATVLLSDAVFPKPTAADVDFSADVTTNNATTGHHGLVPKGDGNASHYLDGNLGWTAPPGVTIENTAVIYLAHQVR